MSSGSIEGFLSLGQTIAHLCESGKRTCANDLIDMSVMIGANTSLSFLTNHVGIGSSSNHVGIESSSNHVGIGSSSNHVGIGSSSNHVGIGSSSHCLFGDSRMIRDTSSTETPTKPRNDGTSQYMIIGGGADAVAVRIACTLSIKY